MESLQRSTTSFRRQGSSGLVWEDRFLSGELQKREEELQQKHDQERAEFNDGKPSKMGPINTTMERSRSNGGGRGFRTGKVSPAIEPPSPKVSACGLCGAFGKKPVKNRRPPKFPKRRSQ